MSSTSISKITCQYPVFRTPRHIHLALDCYIHYPDAVEDVVHMHGVDSPRNAVQTATVSMTI
uniref:WGS project CBMI000000000 data, contig CS3069_c004894 n=1 Tax=Fusarium clavum TaxID=2594811 RepID=A0A090N651_9HYPO|nr:unnamed protein product [Fusarium clavum]